MTTNHLGKPKIPGKNLHLILGLLISVAAFNFIDSQHFVLSQVVNSSHTLVFFLFTRLLLRLSSYTEKPLNKTRTIKIIVFCMACGAAVELIQPHFGRNASFLDFAYDLLGIGAAALLHLSENKTRTNRKHQAKYMITAGLLLLCSAIYPSYQAYLLYTQYAKFPAIYTFEHSSESAFWSANGDSQAEPGVLPSSWSNHESAKSALLLEFNSGRYPGISFQHFVEDWTGFTHLAFEIYSDKPAQLVIRIHDDQHNNELSDRFNKDLDVKPGANQYRLALNEIENAPDNRKLKLSKIKNITLFAIEPEQPVQFYLNSIRLVKEEP